MSRTTVEQSQDVAIVGLQPAHLEKQLKMEGERRQLLHRFIQDNLTEGVDYGRIHVASKEKCARPWECKNEYHFSKPCLFKPGAEKFCSLLQLRAEFIPDKETLEMIGGANIGLVAYRCILSHVPTGSIMAEGRGACAVSEKGGLVNTTVKIAEKRAQIDAVLRLGLSDSFTQDLEDVKELHDAVMETKSQPVKASQKQLDDIRMFAFIKRADMKNIRTYVEKHFGTKLEQITGEQANTVIAMLEKKYGQLDNVAPEVTA